MRILKKILKILGYICLTFFVLIVILVGVLYFTDDGRIADRPDKILAKSGVDFPEYIIVYNDNNMDRGASYWSAYFYKAQFTNSLDSRFIDKLEAKSSEISSGWKKEGNNEYVFSENKDNSCYTSITVNTSDGTVTIDYEWEDW